MQSIILLCLLALSLLLAFVLGLLLWIEISEGAILQDEVAYQESEVGRLERIVKRQDYIAAIERDNTILLARVTRHQGDTAYLKTEILRLRDVLRGAEDQQRNESLCGDDETMVCASKDKDEDTVAADDLQHHIEMQNARIEELEQKRDARIEELEKKHDARIEELEKKHDAERTERTVAESMKWALEQENAELKQTITELRQCSRNTREQRYVVERGQEGAIQTLQECIKTAARLSVEQATRIQVLEERVAEKDAETEEVAKLAEELATKCYAENDALRRSNRHYVKDMRKKWANAWGWAAGEMKTMKARLAELQNEDCDPDDVIVSIAQIFEVEEKQEKDANVEDGAQDMSICSVLQEEVQRLRPQSPVKHSQYTSSITLPWVATPSTLADRRLVRKVALSANPPDSPFAFATNSVQFAPLETKDSRDRAVKRMKMDRR